MNGNVSWLVTCPSTDMNFKSHLKRATAEEIREALAAIEGRKGIKTKKKALTAELTRKISGAAMTMRTRTT